MSSDVAGHDPEALQTDQYLLLGKLQVTLNEGEAWNMGGKKELHHLCFKLASHPDQSRVSNCLMGPVKDEQTPPQSEEEPLRQKTDKLGESKLIQ